METQLVTLRFDVSFFSRQPSPKTWRFWRCPWPASRRWATPSSTRRSTLSFGRSSIGWGKRSSRCSARNNHVSSLPLPCLPSRRARGQMSVFNIHCVPWIIKRLTFVQAPCSNMNCIKSDIKVWIIRLDVGGLLFYVSQRVIPPPFFFLIDGWGLEHAAHRERQLEAQRGILSNNQPGLSVRLRGSSV